MKRRDFIKTSTIAGVAAGSLSSFVSCKNNEKANVNVERKQPGDAAEVLKDMENDILKVQVSADASATIFDKINQQQWKMGPVAIQDEGVIDENRVWYRAERTLMEQYPARFAGEREGENIRFTLVNRQNRVKGSFVCAIYLEKHWLVYRLLEIDEQVPSLIFPPPIISDEIIFPHHAGRRIHKTHADIWTRQFLPFYTHLNMRWIGGSKDDASWVGVFDDKVVDGGGFMANNSITTAWLKTHGKWGNNYAIKYRFIKGDYVNIAKTYRKYLKDKGQFVSLQEKINKNPSLKNMLGGRTLTYFQAWPPLNKHQAQEYLFTPEQIKNKHTGNTKVDFTHQDVMKSLQFAKKQGFSNGLVMLRGWIKDGYDASHPDIWPPEPLLGSIDDMRKLMATGENLTFGLHDNYQDMYQGQPSFPTGINIRYNGDYMTGGFWAGGQAYILNTKNSIEYAKRNWQNMKMLKPAAMFIDTATASKLEESYENGNTQTRLQDYERKFDLLNYFHRQGVLVGSEEGCDMGVPVCDWFENRHGRHPGETIPLWSLVFHDAVFMSRYTSFAKGSDYPKWLEDMLWGYQLQFFITPDFGNVKDSGDTEVVGFDATEMNEEIFRSTFEVDKWHKQIGMEEMTGHRFVSDDFQVEESVFGDKKIIVNFSKTPRIVEGRNIPAMGYKIIL